MAKKVQIFNNFLDQEVFLEIKKFIMSPRCQWRYVNYIAHKDGRDNDNDGYFVHSFKDCHPQTFEDRYPESPHFPLIAKILDKIKYQNIEFSFKNKLILKNLNLELNRGDRILISGKSGTGKTTLVNILLGILIPKKGTVTLDKKIIPNKLFYQLYIARLISSKDKLQLRYGKFLLNFG